MTTDELARQIGDFQRATGTTVSSIEVPVPLARTLVRGNGRRRYQPSVESLVATRSKRRKKWDIRIQSSAFDVDVGVIFAGGYA